MELLSNEQFETIANLEYIATKLKEADIEFIETMEFIYGDNEVVDIEPFYTHLENYVSHAFANIKQVDIPCYYYLMEMFMDPEEKEVYRPKHNINGRTILFLLGLVFTPIFSSGISRQTADKIKLWFSSYDKRQVQQFYKDYSVLLETVYNEMRDIVKDSYREYHSQLENDGIYVEEVLEQNEADIIPMSPLDMMSSITNMFVKKE